MPPIKVLYILHDSCRSGAPAVIATLIESLDRFLVEPTVFLAYDGVYARDFQQKGFEVKTFAGRVPVATSPFQKKWAGVGIFPKNVSSVSAGEGHIIHA
jgi:hypothetical protein